MAASYVSVPRDLTKVKSKVMFNLTKRQLICFGGGAILGVPVFFLTKQILPTSASALLMMIVMMPFFLLAMYQKNGQPLEVYLGHFVQACFVRPKKRPYKTENKYYQLILLEQLGKEEEASAFKKEKGKGAKHRTAEHPV